MSTICKSCGAEIIWAVTTNGKRMPLDAALVSEGTRFSLADSFLPDKPPLATAALSFEMGHRSHFATCPDADKHRRAR